MQCCEKWLSWMKYQPSMLRTRDPNFFPSRIRIKEFKYFIPDRGPDFYPFRIPDPGPGSKGHRNPDPDPHHCLPYSVPTHHEKSEKLQVPEDCKKHLRFIPSWFPVRFTKPTKGQVKKSGALSCRTVQIPITCYWVQYFYYIVQYHIL